MTKRQKKREELVKLHEYIAERISKVKSQDALYYRAVNRRIDKKK